VARYSFSVRRDAKPTEVVAECYKTDEGTVVFFEVTKFGGRSIEPASLRSRIDGVVTEIAE